MQLIRDDQPKAPTKNARLLQWVDEAARLTKPDRVVWCDGSEEEKQRLTEEARRQGHPHSAQPGEAPRLLPPSVEPERRRARRAAHVHLHADEGRGRARPTTGWRPTEAYAKLGKLFDGSMKGRTMYVVPYVMGPVGSPHLEDRRRAHRQHLRRPQHAHHDAHGAGRARDARRRRTTSTAACTRRSTATPSAASSATSRKTTRSGASAAATAATSCSARSASRSASAATSARKRAGSPSTCSSSASRSPRAR